MSLVLAHRVIARRRSNSVAFGAKRTFSVPRLQYRIYEYAAWQDHHRGDAGTRDYRPGM
jgi:hypothetical protein